MCYHSTVSSADELYERWKRNPPTEVRREEFEKVLRRYLGEFLREGSGSSHLYLVSHEALKNLSATRQHGVWSVPVKSGRMVKGYYVKQLVEIVEHLRREGVIP